MLHAYATRVTRECGWPKALLCVCAANATHPPIVTGSNPVAMSLVVEILQPFRRCGLCQHLHKVSPPAHAHVRTCAFLAGHAHTATRSYCVNRLLENGVLAGPAKCCCVNRLLENVNVWGNVVLTEPAYQTQHKESACGRWLPSAALSSARGGLDPLKARTHTYTHTAAARTCCHMCSLHATSRK